MTVSENRQGIVLLPLLARSLARSDGQLISDRVMGITTVLQKMGGQAGGDKGSTQDFHRRNTGRALAYWGTESETSCVISKM